VPPAAQARMHPRGFCGGPRKNESIRKVGFRAVLTRPFRAEHEHRTIRGPGAPMRDTTEGQDVAVPQVRLASTARLILRIKLRAQTVIGSASVFGHVRWP